MSGGFFGFETSLPERRDRQQPSNPPQPPGFAGFASGQPDEAKFGLTNAGEEEDLAVYQWGDTSGTNLFEDDTFNDETFGSVGDVGNDFQFSSQPAQPSKPTGKIASTESRYGPKKKYDPFAASEDDFYGSYTGSRKKASTQTQSNSYAPAIQGRAVAPGARDARIGENRWGNAGQSTSSWGAAPSSTVKPHVPPPAGRNASSAPPAGQIKSLEEIEAEMSQVDMNKAPSQPQMLSLEEIERQMMETAEPLDHPPPPPVSQQPQPQPPLPPSAPVAPVSVQQMNPPPGPPPRESTPSQIPGLAGSGYASQEALLESMFPQLGSAPSQSTASFPSNVNNIPQRPAVSLEEVERMQQIHEMLKAKIEGMAKYNNLMGSSDKDFITRIQLSQLATADPYTSDFYAQVFSALRRGRMGGPPNQNGAPGEEGEGPTVVQVTQGFGFGVGGPTGNRFGKIGTNTMQKLSTQVKKLVENRQHHQKSMNTAALQGALGKVTRGNAAGPRPVLAIPTATRNEAKPTSVLNQQAGVHRQALTKKQVMYTLEELYDTVLELEQKRRDMPPPTAMEEIEVWNEQCSALVESIWRNLMVMEPLDVSTPHPFISLMNPIKGQRLFPRLLRHLSHQQCLTLLTLLIATYPQLDVVVHAPPPPVADSSLISHSDRLDRAKREAETDNFLHCVIPGVDALINRCNLGLVAGLLGICSQRMQVWKVAATRPGVALFTALLSRAQSLKNTPPADPSNPQAPQSPDQGELEQWSKTYVYFLQTLLPHLPGLFPSSLAQKAAFGPGAYLLGGSDADKEREGMEMERRDAEVWGFVAALAVNAPEDEQSNLVAALREKILHTVQSARNPSTPRPRAEAKLRNANMFLNGLGLDASMIE